MQFIHGQSLDQVIRELRRRRGAETSNGVGAAISSPASGLAESLVTGRFPSVEPAGDNVPPESCSPAPRATAEAPADREVAARQLSTTTPASDGSVTSSRPDQHYYRSVARIGLQVASALAYAHRQRMLHRDIKPSNLLLDQAGTVWVTDFGLAKEEGDDLTHSGDVVGTLRYIAPERFGGKVDARSDIYSLGLTLYELLTLRPAFPETDRVRLVQAIAQREPATPRKYDPRVPRDLETIVLKAINKEPAGRYARAEALEEDLRRYLSDRPIGARRAGSWERAARWCRRNPGWAGTIGAVIALLLIMAVGGTVLSIHLLRAVNTLQIVDLERTDKLWQAHLERARALRSSGRTGQRFGALAAVRDAARIKVTPALRDEAVAALVLPDVEVARLWEGCPEDTLHWAFDAKLETYARISRSADLTICRLSPSGEEILARVPTGVNPPFWRLWMSPDARYVACAHSSPREGIGGGVRVWRIDGTTPEVCLDERLGVHLYALAFHPDGRRLAIGHPNRAISVHDLESRESPKRFSIGQVAISLAYHPRDGRLAAACADSIRLFDLDRRKELPPLRLDKITSWSFGLAWHPEGRLLAATSDDNLIHVWDTVTHREAISPLSAHATSGIFVTFNHRGDRLVSTAWDHQTRLWDVGTGQLLLEMSGDRGLQFGPDDESLGVERAGTALRIWRLADGHELKRLRHSGPEAGGAIFAPVLGTDGRVLAAGMHGGLGFFDVHSGEELAFARLSSTSLAMPIHFDRTDGWMTCGNTGAVLWPARTSKDHPGVLEVGPPQVLATASHTGADATPDGRIRVVPQGRQTLILDRDRPGRRVEARPQYDVRNSAISPNGRWVAGCSWWSDGHSKSVRIWQADSGHHVTDLPVEGLTTARFSPDGKWLITYRAPDDCRLWEVGTWRFMKQLDGYASWIGDAGLLALHDVPGTIQLVVPDTGNEVYRLTAPETRPYTAGCMTPDGSTLVAYVLGGQALYVWDLRLIRHQLRQLGMDWDIPEFNSEVKEPDRIAVRVDAGVLRRPPVDDDALALAIWSLQLALQPISPEAFLERGLAEDRLDRHADAVRDLETFLMLSPKSDRRRTEVQLRLASDYHERLKDDSKATAAVAEVLDAPLHAVPWRGRLALLCNDLARQAAHGIPPKTSADLFLRLARKAIELEPYNFLYQNTLGVVLYRVGRYEEAIRCLEANLPNSGRYAAFDYYFLAMSHQHLGNSVKAREYFDLATLSHESESSLSPIHRRELDAFRAEAEKVLGPNGDP
jgi:eukaryotic-like serine/threonine-protein kinase